MNPDKELGKRMLKLKLIWLALSSCLVVYLFVGLWAGPHVTTDVDEKTFGIIRQALYLIAIITFVSIRYAKKFMLSEKVNLRPTGNNQDPATYKYEVAMLVTWALSESIGIHGLVLSLIGSNTTDLYILLGMAAFAMFLFRPNREEVEEFMRRSSGKHGMPNGLT